MAKKRDFDYFESFRKQAAFSLSAAECLHTTLLHYDADRLHDTMESMHVIEHSADDEKHEMMNCLVKEFVTPIDREDILHLAQQIDDVTDSVEDVLIKAYIYNIRSVRKEAIEFANVIVSCCEALVKVFDKFPDYKKTDEIKPVIIEINRLEETGDRLYTGSVRSLFTSCSDPIEVIAWTEMFERLEACCDACEHTANLIESVVLQNS